MILYHGSTVEVRKPLYGVGKRDNDYGQGFYMTKTANLGREWAVRENTDGWLGKYKLDTRGLNMLNLTDGRHTVLQWLCLVLTNRTVDITSVVMNENLEYLKNAFSLDTSPYDCIQGWPADNISFSLALNFVSNGLAYEKLCSIMHLGCWGMQYVLTRKACERISFLGSEPVYSSLWYPKKLAREARAAADVERIRQQQKEKPSQGLYMTDIVRQGMDADDTRLCL
ncbi:MAG: DUF3990 domain-containing protein [Clostridia bacterium]|nr:DUF3990 domain-containing protein [Clostridia bacterium]